MQQYLQCSTTGATVMRHEVQGTRRIGAGCWAQQGGRHLVTIALQERRCICKGVHSNLHSALLQSSVQPFGQVKDGLQLEQ